MSFSRYPAYKDSGVAWLGAIPAHWPVHRIRDLFDLQKRDFDPDDDIVTAFRDGEVTLRRNRRTEGFTNSVHDHGYQGVRPSDLVIHAMDAFAGAIGVSDSTGKATPVYSVCTPRSSSDSSWYFAHALRVMSMRGYISALAKGIRERSTEFRWAESRNVVVPRPSANEQAAIVAFLDRETAKIDTLVAEQRRLIDLLQEKRRAVISHAVTKGLNPSASMKDSGVAWLGEVPAHWQVTRMRFLCDIETGARDTEDAVDDGDYPFFVRSQSVERIDTAAFDCEAVLTAGDGAGVGKVFHHFVGKFNAHQRVYVLTKFRGIAGRLIFHYLRELFHRVALEGGAKSTVDSLRRPMFANFPVCLPPRNEQEVIVAHVEALASEFGELIDAAQSAVDLLLQRRAVLITAAVTGQIDVRGLAAAVAA